MIFPLIDRNRADKFAAGVGLEIIAETFFGPASKSKEKPKQLRGTKVM